MSQVATKRIIIVNKGGVPFKKIPVTEPIVDKPVTEPITTAVKPIINLANYKFIIVDGVRKLVKLDTLAANPTSVPAAVSLENKDTVVKKTIIIKPKGSIISTQKPLVEPTVVSKDTVEETIASKDTVEPEVNPKPTKELTTDQLLFRAIRGNRPDDIVKYIEMGGDIYYQNCDALESIAERGLIKAFEAIYSKTIIKKDILEDCIEAAEEYNRAKLVVYLKTKL